ncbi:hypothetical protein PVAP13_9KG355813 [Panicum virgatum]|uniref:Uncharacterized protein n=1 Tax=Panicum virgatum TaxID=38727 RepID=A0A8T0NS40_PANVG|nr:hypothetical protein PVAP13_9KG355813 [Panicum virgatum]
MAPPAAGCWPTSSFPTPQLPSPSTRTVIPLPPPLLSSSISRRPCNKRPSPHPTPLPPLSVGNLPFSHPDLAWVWRQIHSVEDRRRQVPIFFLRHGFD